MTRDEELRDMEACRRLGDDQARTMRHLTRSRTTPEERRETKRANRQYRRDRWRAWRWEHPAEVMS